VWCCFSAFFNEQAAQIGANCAKQNQKSVFGIPAHIKIITGNEKPYVFDPVWNKKIEQHNYRKKHQKIQRIE
jgi:hypothetical protein